MPDERPTEMDIAQSRTNQELMRAIGRLEGKVDSVLLSQQNSAAAMAELEKRTTKNENDLNGIKAKVAALGAIIGGAVSFLGNWLWHKITGRI
jgi:hypothetical protein